MTSYLNDYGSVHRNSISGYFTEVDNLTNDADYITNLKDVTRHHWKPIDCRTDCSNRLCSKTFSAVLERPHHCRRCGDIFCNACTQYRRRLNKLAHFDPEGQLYKVCKSCFETDQITDGQVCSHTKDFMYLRSRFRNHTDYGLSSISSKSAFSLKTECDRLIRGFASSVGKSEIKRTVLDLRSMLLTPDWMKSSNWMRASMADKCHVCQGTFGILRSKKFCRLCGQSVCKSCSSQNLLLFFPDDDHQTKGLPKLAIIKFVGCPEVEPEISLHLRVCPTCEEKMIDIQIKFSEEEAVTLDPSNDKQFIDLLHRLDLKFQKTEDRVRTHLPNYVDVVESLEDGARASRAQSNTKVLAKAQGDLADVLANHVTNVQQLKKLVPKSDTQMHLLKNYIRAKCEFYLDSMCLYRSLKEKLSKSVPIESLNFIQRIMDKNAVISTHLYLRQLVYELLHLMKRYSIDDGDLPAFLMRVEEEIEVEVKQCLILNKENVDEHSELVKDMIRSRINDHKLIRPSQKLVTEQGSKYVFDFMLTRTEDILSQVMNQLQVASASRSFPRGKKALEMALDEVKRKKNHTEDDMKDYHFV